MTLTRRSAVYLSSAVLGLTAAVAVAAQSAYPVVPADKVQFAPAPPFLPAGAQLSVLEGNPSAKGPVTLRLKLPANYVIPPHWHSMDERVTVLSGAFNIGMGDKLDRLGSTRLEPGGFVSLKSNMHHFGWVATPTVVQISLEGPFDIFYVNASEDPQKAMKH
ncbi:MAG: cupin domain-containing protein [Acidobacteriota bacterium]